MSLHVTISTDKATTTEQLFIKSEVDPYRLQQMLETHFGCAFLSMTIHPPPRVNLQVHGSYSVHCLKLCTMKELVETFKLTHWYGIVRHSGKIVASPDPGIPMLIVNHFRRWTESQREQYLCLLREESKCNLQTINCRIFYDQDKLQQFSTCLREQGHHLTEQELIDRVLEQEHDHTSDNYALITMLFGSWDRFPHNYTTCSLPLETQTSQDYAKAYEQFLHLRSDQTCRRCIHS